MKIRIETVQRYRGLSLWPVQVGSAVRFLFALEPWRKPGFNYPTGRRIFADDRNTRVAPWRRRGAISDISSYRWIVDEGGLRSCRFAGSSPAGSSVFAVRPPQRIYKGKHNETQIFSSLFVGRRYCRLRCSRTGYGRHFVDGRNQRTDRHVVDGIVRVPRKLRSNPASRGRRKRPMSSEPQTPTAPVHAACWTHTTSGHEIKCFHAGTDGDDLLLDSPEHGYVIRRLLSEVRKQPSARRWSY